MKKLGNFSLIQQIDALIYSAGTGGCSGPPLESELSSICIGFSLINDVRARGWPPPGKGGPPLENFLVTPMALISSRVVRFCRNWSLWKHNYEWQNVKKLKCLKFGRI